MVHYGNIVKGSTDQDKDNLGGGQLFLSSQLYKNRTVLLNEQMLLSKCVPSVINKRSIKQKNKDGGIKLKVGTEL